MFKKKSAIINIKGEVDKTVTIIPLSESIKKLCIAIENDKINDVRKILKSLKQINEIAVLQIVVQNLQNKNGIQILNLIIKKGIDINSIIQTNIDNKDNRELLLSIFVEYNNCELVEQLIRICRELCIDLDMNASPIRVPPLRYSIQKSNIQMIELLLMYGADPNYVFHFEGVYYPLLSTAISSKNIKIVELLLTYEANVNYITPNTNAIQLIHAIQKIDNDDIAKLLIDNGADIHLSPNGISPLYVAVQSNKLQIVSILLDMGASPNSLESFSGNNISPLYMAIQLGHTDMACLLIDGGADINHSSIITENSQVIILTPLYKAVETNNVIITLKLLKSGVDLEFKTRFNHRVMLPLELAYCIQEELDKSNYTDMIAILEDYGAKRYICNNTDCYNDGTNGCSKCKKAQYCSKECQLAHWKDHKKDCNTLCKNKKKELSEKNS
jgi:ankyrin repeat protein